MLGESDSSMWNGRLSSKIAGSETMGIAEGVMEY